MPPLVAESDADSGPEEAIPHYAADPSEQAKDELADAVDGNASEADEDDEDEEVFIVESILNHRGDWDDGEMRYEVKWKGYEKKSDRTWETEGNLEGAKEILQDYWAQLGGRPMAKPNKKKRSRQSTSGGATPDTSSTKLPKRGRKSDAEMSMKPTDPAGTEDVDEDWRAPKLESGSWEKHVQAIETIERDGDDVLWAFLVWNDKNDDGRFYRSKARLTACYDGCPQKMLQFYEGHLVFTSTKTSALQNNGDSA